MNADEKSRRIRRRLELAIPVRVRGHDSADHEWTEMSRLIDVTPFGARLKLTRPTEAGRLLHVTIAMPRAMRCFDHAEDQYRVWSLVRNVISLVPSEKSPAIIEAGLAFVGKYPPASFLADPGRRYEIMDAQSKSGLSVAREIVDEVVSEAAVTDKRCESRHFIPIEVDVEVIGEKSDAPVIEKTVTENISRKGASVFTSLNIERGRFVRITSEYYKVSIFAAVRARRVGPDGIARLHVEFAGGEWPLQGIE
jgi:hypothetical protein